MKKFGYYLEKPTLRFNSASTFASHKFPRSGIKKFGPYDSTIFELDKIKAGIIYPNNMEGSKNIFVNSLTKGEGQFEGFKKWFRVDLEIVEEKPLDLTNINIENQALDIMQSDIDIIYLLFPQKEEHLYSKFKSIFSGNGLPSQFLTVEKIRANNIEWVIENIALASYAKVGGTPWVVSKNLNEPDELLIGVSRVQDKSKKYIIGFVTLFTQNGEFILLHSKAPVIKWDDYINGLKLLLIEAFQAFCRIKGKPKSIILHFRKKPGFKELEAIKNALLEIGDIPYALIHLNEFSNIHLFDTSDTTYIPLSGLITKLSTKKFLLLLDGRTERYGRKKIGVPSLLDISIDNRSTIDIDEESSRLIKQIFNISHINWRGFNANLSPITLNYSRLISKVVSDIGIDKWNNIITSGKMMNKAWFL